MTIDNLEMAYDNGVKDGKTEALTEVYEAFTRMKNRGLTDVTHYIRYIKQMKEESENE